MRIVKREQWKPASQAEHKKVQAFFEEWKKAEEVEDLIGDYLEYRNSNPVSKAQEELFWASVLAMVERAVVDNWMHFDGMVEVEIDISEAAIGAIRYLTPIVLGSLASKTVAKAFLPLKLEEVHALFEVTSRNPLQTPYLRW